MTHSATQLESDDYNSSDKFEWLHSVVQNVPSILVLCGLSFHNVLWPRSLTLTDVYNLLRIFQYFKRRERKEQINYLINTDRYTSSYILCVTVAFVLYLISVSKSVIGSKCLI